MILAEYERLLSYAGLGMNESKVYLALLKLGRAPPGIITQESAVHRRNVYDALERLLQKGLVTFIMEGKRKIYQPVSPRRLVEITRTQENELSKAVPSLEKLHAVKREPYEAKLYIGNRGLKAVMDDQLEAGKDIWIFGSHSRVEERLKYYFPQFERQRLKKKMHVRLVLDETARGVPATKLELTSARFLPKSFFGPISTNIYGDSIIIINYSDPVLITLIKNQKLADSYRKFYRLLWSAAKE
jgi:sugar-specific transcriptional regulator TrmB